MELQKRITRISKTRKQTAGIVLYTSEMSNKNKSVHFIMELLIAA